MLNQCPDKYFMYRNNDLRFVYIKSKLTASSAQLLAVLNMFLSRLTILDSFTCGSLTVAGTDQRSYYYLNSFSGNFQVASSKKCWAFATGLEDWVVALTQWLHQTTHYWSTHLQTNWSSDFVRHFDLMLMLMMMRLLKKTLLVIGTPRLLLQQRPPRPAQTKAFYSFYCASGTMMMSQWPPLTLPNLVFGFFVFY